MFPHTDLRHLWTLADLPEAGVRSLLATARDLKRSTDEGRPQRPLRGRHLALLSEAPEGESVQAFVSAGIGLGAQVTVVRPSTARLDDPYTLRDAAVMFGRLYDAMVCDGLREEVVEALGQFARVPVCSNLSDNVSAARSLTDRSTGADVLVDVHHVLQALLLRMMG